MVESQLHCQEPHCEWWTSWTEPNHWPAGSLQAGAVRAYEEHWIREHGFIPDPALIEVELGDGS